MRYGDYGLVIELDGRVSHSAETAFRDLERDNVTALRGDLVLHYGWDDVMESPCRVAYQVAAVLSARGWTGRPEPCGRPECVFGEPDS